MILTREQAIAEHRKMWRWIAGEIEKKRRCVNVECYKWIYLAHEGYEIYPDNNCFLCAYDSQEEFSLSGPCEECPVETENRGIECLGGMYYKVCRAETWQQQSALARQIAELPEREDV